ncbi:MAG: 30S ribosomal protein S4 [Candidatus Micrarchaeia archaeon]
MGDPVKPRKKYERPAIQWSAERIKEENALKEEYGLKNTREIWRARAELRKIRANARKLLSIGASGEKKSKEILNRVLKYGILKPKEDRESTLDDLLALDVRDILDRRLQTRVYKKGLARTIKQARQLITHGYIAVEGKCITVPGYIVPLAQDDGIGYYKPIDIAPKVESKEASGKEGENDG